MKKILMLLICSIFLCSHHAGAKRLKIKGLEDGPHIGLATAGDTGRDAFAYGWQVEYNPNEDLWGLRLGFTTHNDKLNYSNPAILGFPGNTKLDLDVYHFYISGRISIVRNKHVNTYVGGGVGYFIFDEDLKVDSSQFARVSTDFQDEFGYHIYIGCEVYLTEHWELFTEAQYNFLSTDLDLNVSRSDSAGNIQSVKTIDNIDYNFLLLKLGLNYVF